MGFCFVYISIENYNNGILCIILYITGFLQRLKVCVKHLAHRKCPIKDNYHSYHCCLFSFYWHIPNAAFRKNSNFLFPTISFFTQNVWDAYEQAFLWGPRYSNYNDADPHLSWEKTLKAICRKPLGRGGLLQCEGFPGWLCESTLSTVHIHSTQ